jgi:hypothetical protein
MNNNIYIIIAIYFILICLICFIFLNVKKNNEIESHSDISKYIKKIKDFENLNNINIIPLNIYQTWSTLDLPPLMKKNVELLKLQNPEFNHYLYDDNMCRDFIKDNFDKSILYTYDKLKPGAYKADLFRYCILYKYGGIYLDIKYKCVDIFKLIYLTNAEYFVRDHQICEDKCYGTFGIYQALLICLPKNKILLKCINEIVENVKNNYYNYYNDIIGNALSISGPLLMSKFFYEFEISKFDLNFDKTKQFINFKNIHILEIYKGYREEQNKYAAVSHYSTLFEKRDVYNYLNLKNDNLIDFSKNIIKNINNKNIKFYSSSPSIINSSDEPDTYIINIKWVNYTPIDYSNKVIILNSRFKINKNFERISDEIFLDNEIEDIRLFNHNNIIYYIGSYFDYYRENILTTSYLYNYNPNKFTLVKKIIEPNFNDLNIINKEETKWSMFDYKGELAVVYSWYPILICKIDYETEKLNIIDIKYNTPEHFKDANGSTSGFIFNNEIWFVLNKYQKNSKYSNYQHCFAIFDLNMNLLRYSELFKLENESVEYCLGLIVENYRIILSYSIHDNSTKIGIYYMDNIKNNILWYDN